MSRCTGKTKTGQRCRALAMTGLKRCSRHTLSKRSAKKKEIAKKIKKAKRASKKKETTKRIKKIRGEKPKSGVLSGAKYFKYEGFTKRCNLSYKYWGVKVQGTYLITHYGRFESKGRISKKKFASSNEAKEEMAKRIREKKNKGYKKTTMPRILY